MQSTILTNVISKFIENNHTISILLFSMLFLLIIKIKGIKMETILYHYNNSDYVITHNRLCNMGAWNSKAFKWFLCDIDNNYIGYFDTYKKLKLYIKNINH